jgi:hypothetical protein
VFFPTLTAKNFYIHTPKPKITSGAGGEIPYSKQRGKAQFRRRGGNTPVVEKPEGMKENAPSRTPPLKKKVEVSLQQRSKIHLQNRNYKVDRREDWKRSYSLWSSPSISGRLKE